MVRGVRDVMAGAAVKAIAVSDGGDGLVDALQVALGGRRVESWARGPMGGRRRAAYLWIPRRRTAVIETALASGLSLVAPCARRPLRATSRGTGDLMRDALRRGARTIIVGMGGTAASDGGAGMARALGARLLDHRGREIADGAGALPRLARIEADGVAARLSGVRVLALSDVANPLLGPKGSAAVFGPQKGASPREVRAIERALTRWAAALENDLGARVARVPGAGAAGGLGAGLLAFARARIVPGARWVLQKTGASKALKGADLVLTCEGRLDATSLCGKAPVELARQARRRGVACAAIAGQVDDSVRPALRKAGMTRVVSFAQAGAKSKRDSMRQAAAWARKAAAVAASGLALAVFSPAARSEDFKALDDLYWHRDRPGNLDALISRLESSESPERFWRLCRAKVRRGEDREKKADRLADYSMARRDCEQAVAVSSTSVDAQFWLGVAMGRWGEAKGVMRALFLIGPIRLQMNETLRLEPGHGGAHRLLGELWWQIPALAGGDKKRALFEFEEAVRLAPNHSANYQPLAEAYLYYRRIDDAKRVLKAVEAIAEPADPAEYPENLADCRKLLSGL